MAKFAGLRDPITLDFERSTVAYCVDAFSISMGSLLGVSPVTAFVESATGISGTFYFLTLIYGVIHSLAQRVARPESLAWSLASCFLFLFSSRLSLRLSHLGQLEVLWLLQVPWWFGSASERFFSNLQLNWQTLCIVSLKSTGIIWVMLYLHFLLL